MATLEEITSFFKDNFTDADFADVEPIASCNTACTQCNATCQYCVNTCTRCQSGGS